MIDENQQPEPEDETDGFVVQDGRDLPGANDAPENDGQEDEAPPPEKKAEDDEGSMPDWMKRRLARANRKRDEAARERDEFQEKLKVAQGMVEKLRRQKNGGIHPNDFETVKEYSDARRAIEDGDRDLSAPPAMTPELREALGDLREEVEAADPKLWEAMAEIPEDEAFFGAQMVMRFADLEGDAPAAMRAWLDLTPDERKDIADLSPRRARRALAELVGKAPKAKAAPAPEAPARAPNGQFRRQSDAPPPVEPVRTSSAGQVPIDKLSFSEFEARRNAEERGAAGSRW